MTVNLVEKARRVRRISDKPHRCPECHTVVTNDLPDRWTLWLTCSGCNVKWVYAQNPKGDPMWPARLISRLQLTLWRLRCWRYDRRQRRAPEGT